MAMKALKDSLGIADNMGWNGDPCHPTCWEGVECKPNPLGSGLVISEIDLQNQGLAGFITKDIKLLTNLISLNLSNNYLSGPIPTDVHSIHLRGGSFNVSENRGLCGLGLPSAPRQCSTLSMMGRETKGLTSFVVFIVLWLSYIPFGMPGIHDENDPIHHIAFQEGRVRIKMAGIYSLFHWVRVKMMKWYIPEPAFDIGQAYKLWSLSRVLELVYGLVGIFAVFSVLLSRSRFTKLSHRFALVSIFTWALSQSIKAIMLIYDQPWLMLLETVWLLRTLIFSIFVINRPPAFDMRIWNSHVMIVVLGVIQSLELFDYITITVVIIVWLVWLVFTMGT